MSNLAFVDPHDTQKDIEKYFLSKNRRKVALKSPKISLNKGYFGRFKGYIFFVGKCWCSTGGFFASEGGSRHRGFTIVLTFRVIFPFCKVIFGEPPKRPFK